MDLSKFGQQKEAEQERDILGGSFVQDSDAKEWYIDVAYLSESDKGALAVNLKLSAVQGGDTYRETIYFTNRNKETTYEKDGKIYHSKGFNQVNSLCLLTAGIPFNECSTETKMVPIYDFDAGKEIPKEVECLVEVEGESAIFAILKIKELKRVYNEAIDQWEETDEEREINQIDKIFRASDRCTVAEVLAELPTGVFIEKWLEKNKGQVVDRTKGKVSSGSASKGKPAKGTRSSSKGGPGASKSLFAK